MALHGIHIKPSHRGKFTAKGISVEEGLHSKDATTRKEANFARMAKRHFKKLKKSAKPKKDDGEHASRMYGEGSKSKRETSSEAKHTARQHVRGVHRGAHP
jgi:hypothetical protein